ncbi:hypothetical protein Fcan01_17067 [Folsomia candida]|uniref:Uncharacterized protein n=1 Tax=Folsomia candida TaxID=158441 RepID=A0A226DUD9_FOLCA|nr:hypothetical protein Fcan01_17067 [Folsomia candida]
MRSCQGAVHKLRAPFSQNFDHPPTASASRSGMDYRTLLTVTLILAAGIHIITAYIASNSLDQDSPGDGGGSSGGQIILHPCHWTGCGNPWPKCQDGYYENDISRCGFPNRKRRQCCRTWSPIPAT